ncbi:UPF0149 family protein [Peredibacter starrii]|uniref:Uncharacterized protein n=1 Tax=Peredibacter starrii TaxID=28202 RepID=A0AAX4HS81_9BACT|nr:UPF0149 family protein [Peredibacter starrii]WPU65865.1 hypothetical protein SOO65_03815 [Peredibacter starrii]
MQLQELINQTDLDLTADQVKAFFLGVLCAEKPMPFNKVMEEIFEEVPEARTALEPELRKLWDEQSRNLKKALSEMFQPEEDVRSFLELAKNQLDYFLTAMSLSGTNTENCDDEDLAELIDELEDTVADMDDYLADEEPTDDEGEEFKELLLDTWKEFVATKL